MALTKSDIISKVSNEIELTEKESVAAVENIIEIIKSALESGDDVLMSGFGKFSVKEKDERLGRNPATGNDMVISGRKVVSFKCSGKLKERINGKN